MKRVGLDAWYDYFDKHLPANMKTIALLRATTAADLRRMATKANMRLDTKTTQQVLDALEATIVVPICEKDELVAVCYLLWAGKV